MQGDEAELGGFKGRTNKLVDGCYSWWVGGVFNLLKHFSPVEEERDAEVTNDVKAEEDVWAEDLDGIQSFPIKFSHICSVIITRLPEQSSSTPGIYLDSGAES